MNTEPFDSAHLALCFLEPALGGGANLVSGGALMDRMLASRPRRDKDDDGHHSEDRDQGQERKGAQHKARMFALRPRHPSAPITFICSRICPNAVVMKFASFAPPQRTEPGKGCTGTSVEAFGSTAAC